MHRVVDATVPATAGVGFHGSGPRRNRGRGTVSEVGRGQKTYDFGRARGRWVRLEGPDDVLGLMDAGAAGLVAVVRDAGATFLGPVFDELAGVVCTGGTIRSHIGIVSREYRVPGVVATVLSEEPDEGAEVELDATGPDGVGRLVEG